MTEENFLKTAELITKPGDFNTTPLLTPEEI